LICSSIPDTPLFPYTWSFLVTTLNLYRFVCTVDRSTKNIERLRSYRLADEPNIQATILQAALATSAAPTFFQPIQIGNRTFADGALGANNPVDEVESEASSIWCPETGNLQLMVKCFISIGTGHPGITDFDDKFLGFFRKTLAEISTEREKTEKKFIARWRDPYIEKRYFRFDVQQGLQQIGLAEFQKMGEIEAATHAHLTHTERKQHLKDCVQNLKLKKSMWARTYGSRGFKIVDMK
jgi:predicted acylesterase/phospholipase RssA